MKINNNQKKTDLKKECGEKLHHMRINITPADKFDALVKFKLSRPTLEKYLCGDVAKLDVGCALLEFFTDRVNKKKEIIANA